MRRPRRSLHEWLLAWWGRKENDLMTGGFSRPDMRLLNDALSSPLPIANGRSLLEELDARGYDTTTLRFEIRRKPSPRT